MEKWLIRGGRVIDPANRVDKVCDLLIEDGLVAAIGSANKDFDAKGAQVIEAKGKLVTPGLIDMHVHLREPGREDEETIESGLRAAAKGGFTSIACMANTSPPVDSAPVVRHILDRAAVVGLGNVWPVAAVSRGLEGKILAPIGELVEAGAVAFSDDGNPVMNAELMRRALEYARIWDRSVISHSEDIDLTAGGQIHEGLYSTVLGLKGMPAAAEECMVARDTILTELSRGKLHVAHVSTAGSVAVIKRAKEREINVTCEVTPHHLVLMDEDVLGFNTNFKVNPPLRSIADVEALREALADGTIDVIASDHAPHARHEKESEFDLAPFGMIGLETTLPVILSKIVEIGLADLTTAVRALTVRPAEILGIDRGHLSVGATADVTVIDPNAKVKVDATALESKSQNTPFEGWELTGKASHVMVAGRLVLADGEFWDADTGRDNVRLVELSIRRLAKEG